ncbi:MAG: hypothetical protein ACLRWM_10255 [Streptococcus sp.]
MDAAKTVQSIYEQARYKLAQSIVRGYFLKISGNYFFVTKLLSQLLHLVQLKIRKWRITE